MISTDFIMSVLPEETLFDMLTTAQVAATTMTFPVELYKVMHIKRAMMLIEDELERRIGLIDGCDQGQLDKQLWA